MDAKWLNWATRLQSIAQAGLEYSKDSFDRERFEAVRAISIEIMHEYTGIDAVKLNDLFANETGYQTPKIDVRAAIFNSENEILMVKEKLDGKWSLPGGWADIGLSICENIIKESREEAGAEVAPRRIVAIIDRYKHLGDLYPYSVYKIFVECDFIKAEFCSNMETTEHGFFSINNLPDLSVSRNTKEQIEMCFTARTKKHHEAVFD